jgi:hypothetical protein
MAVAKKGALSSKTIQGALIAGIPAVDALLVQFGFTAVPVLAPTVAAGMTLFGVIMAVYGRVKATNAIAKLF